MRKLKYKYSDCQVANAVKHSHSIIGVLRYLGLNTYGSSHFTMKNRIKSLGLDTTHFTGKAWNKGKTLGYKKFNFSEFFVENSTKIISSSIKKKLIHFKILKEECSLCKLPPIWNGNSIVLQIDHINGKKSDNRLENLRLLCPNCHSQTPTFTGRQLKNKNPGVAELPDAAASNTAFHKEVKVGILSPGPNICLCGQQINKKSSLCSHCFHSYQEKIVWPSNEELQDLLWKVPTSKLAKQLGVSDVAIKKRTKRKGLTKPPRGYWQKQQNKVL